MKLSEYKNDEQQNQQTVNNDHQNKSLQDLFNTYKDMDQTELLQTLMGEVAKQKQQGTFDYSQLQKSLNQVLPFLNEDQKSNLLTILQKIK